MNCSQIFFMQNYAFLGKKVMVALDLELDFLFSFFIFNGIPYKLYF